MDPSLVTRRSRRARAAGPRSATVEAGGDAVDPINTTDKEKIRRARKRSTDRQSQRVRRERQRIYIRQLEETVQSYKDTFSGGGSELVALLNEQERLQIRCKELEAAVARIKNLASSMHVSDDVCCSNHDPETSFVRKPQQASVSISQSPPLAEFDNSGLSDGPQSCSDQGPPPHPYAGQPVLDSRIMDVSAQLPPHEMDYFDLSSIVGGTATELSFVPTSTTMRNSLLMESAISIDFSRELPTHPSFPKLCHSTGKWDEILLSMVNEARLQHRHGQFCTSEPSLRSLLSDNSTDVLAYRLFHHICFYRSMPLHLMLSIFWVQYILLRWYVLGTQTDFLRIPEFLRPTDLETRIQHRLCIGMLVWPDLRRALIRDSHTTDPERIGIDLLEHMSTTWSPTVHDSGVLIGSTDVYAIIQHQAQRMETWKVDRRFQEKYLQFANCRLG